VQIDGKAVAFVANPSMLQNFREVEVQGGKNLSMLQNFLAVEVQGRTNPSMLLNFLDVEVHGRTNAAFLFFCTQVSWSTRPSPGFFFYFSMRMVSPCHLFVFYPSIIRRMAIEVALRTTMRANAVAMLHDCPFGRTIPSRIFFFF